MKILMIHSNGAKMRKMAKATSRAQEYEKDKLELEGLVLVCYISVEDQDTFDVNIISKQAADEIEEAVDLIEGFPQRIEEQNEEIREFNRKIERRNEVAAKNPKVEPSNKQPRELKSLILKPEKYKVDKILVYPWAHLSKFLSQEPQSMDVCPTVANILEDRGYEAHFSPFGWYKAFEIECLGHEVAEMYRDVKLSLLADEVRATSKFKIVSEDGEIIDFCESSEESKRKAEIPKRYQTDDWKEFQDFCKSEVLDIRDAPSKTPPHIKLMHKYELADFDDASDAGNLRWYPMGVLMKQLIRDYNEQLVLENDALYVDTPVMYTVKNKKLTAQTARFPAKTYWVHSGNDRYLLRFASDFLLFNMFSQMQIRSEDLPLGIYEYETYAFRREQAGEVSGLRRLRTFTMPDYHTLCLDHEQAVKEFKNQFLLVNDCLNGLGVSSYMVLRTTEEFWAENKDWIIEIVKNEGNPALVELWPERYYYFILKYERPVVSAFGNTATLSTIQIDVESAQKEIEQYGQVRQKYNIVARDKEGEEHHPIILHNSPSGAIERVIWALLESNARFKKEIVPGFKTWLSPVQVRVMTVTNAEEEVEYAQSLLENITEQNIRCDYDDRDERIGKKIRTSEVEWIPYTVIVGSNEVETNTVSIRKRKVGEKYDKRNTSDEMKEVKLEKLIEMVNEDLEGFPRRPLPQRYRYYSKRVSFR